MLTAHDTPDDEPVAPQCRPTVDRLQRALDGGASPGPLESDSHATGCPACRERVRAARVLLSVLGTPPGPVAAPADFADRVVAAMWAERRARTRVRGVVATVAALAAAVLLFIGLNRGKQPETGVPLPVVPNEFATKPEPAPAPREKPPTPEPAPEPRPLRVGDALANAGQAILDAPKPLAESVAGAPKLFDVLSGPFKNPPPPDPMAAALEPARKSLADLPVAARSGFEPVTGTAEKAFNRFLRDVGAVKPNS